MQRKAFTIIELLIVTCVFLIMAVVLTPFVQTTKAHANRINCANNLRQISLGLHKYALDHRGSFPENLGALYPNYVSDGATLDCPGRKSAGIKYWTPGSTNFATRLSLQNSMCRRAACAPIWLASDRSSLLIPVPAGTFSITPVVTLPVFESMVAVVNVRSSAGKLCTWCSVRKPEFWT